MNETLPEKEDFYSHLNMDGITDADYVHSKRICKDIEICKDFKKRLTKQRKTEITISTSKAKHYC